MVNFSFVVDQQWNTSRIGLCFIEWPTRDKCGAWE